MAIKRSEVTIRKAYDPLDVGLPAVLWIEQMVLGIAISSPARMNEFAVTVKLDDFSTQIHRLIWLTCVSLHERSMPIGTAMIAEELFKHGQLDAISVGYLSELERPVNAISELPNPSRYVAVLRDYGLRRCAIFKANDILIDASSRTCNPAEVLMEASEAFARMAAELNPNSDFKSPAQILASMGGPNKYPFPQYAETVVTTPLPSLNNILMSGGFVPGDLVILAGHTSRGKSAMAVNFALNAAEQGKRVVFISLEMEEIPIYDRIIALTGDIDGYRLHRENPSLEREAERLSDIHDSLVHVHPLPITINYRPGMSPKVLLAELRRIQATGGLDFVVVDYLQLMSGGDRFGNRTEEVSHVSRSLKRIAGELSVPILALSQFSRESAKQEREPRLDDLRESGSIEQDCNVALLLHITRMWDIPAGVKTADAKLIIAKQRNGASAAWIPLKFHVTTGRFVED